MEAGVGVTGKMEASGESEDSSSAMAEMEIDCGWGVRESCCWLEALLRLRNSFVGERSRVCFAGVVIVLVGTRLPSRLASILGSMDLRLLCPPRGMVEVSTAKSDSSSHLFSRSQLLIWSV